MNIDGVFSGGGIKGLALIGAYEVLEEKGFTFKRLAGTSAGAIMAALIAAGYTSKEIKVLITETDMKKFLDQRTTILPFALAKWLLLYWRMGMYVGNELEEWLGKKMADKGIYTFKDLPKGRLRLIASDLSTGRLIVLPDDLDNYGIPKETFPVARAIRMSCGVPYFFEPVKLRSLSGENIIVDGGILSNFPMWLFQNDYSKKERPVLGIKLSYNLEEQPKRVIKNGLSLFEALFSTMKDAHDARYISRKLEKDIIFIPIDESFSSEFFLSEEKKHALIEKGRIRTKQFLEKWSY
ncbi:patatin-like phospholipase family protein [Bacillus sp. FJAT-49732]|uniref:Patatin-like phospholipase family protein n=1 Tax=Lederbergia citrisecunda TaxID=2833583 RepID=A0A942TLJ3_9BACI|nr:patatin-like phospholipase family protein [Lederbergia citrisecunda]MBS4199643.1 patatin-like phospholipase family protein [Lederbergia citrisecunda]